MAFDFNEGKETAIRRENLILNDVNDALTDLLKKGFWDLLEKYPWMVTKKFMERICEDLDQNLIHDLTRLLGNFFAGQGSFVSFAIATVNTNEAINLAQDLQRRLVDNLSNFLENYTLYSDQLQAIISRPQAIYNADLPVELRALFNKYIADLNDRYKRQKNAIAQEIQDNTFLAAMDTVNDIIFQYLLTRIEQYGNAVPEYADGVEDLLTEADRAIQTAAAEATQEAKRRAREWEMDMFEGKF